MNLLLSPYIGAKPLEFGMTENEARLLLGDPIHRMKNDFGPSGEELIFEQASLAFDDMGKLFQIGLDKSFTGCFLYEDVDLFRDPNVLQFLIEKDGNPYLWVGFVMLLNLGIRLGGFHEIEESGKSVSVFAKGRYDSKVSRFQTFRTAS